MNKENWLKRIYQQLPGIFQILGNNQIKCPLEPRRAPKVIEP